MADQIGAERRSEISGSQALWIIVAILFITIAVAGGICLVLCLIAWSNAEPRLGEAVLKGIIEEFQRESAGLMLLLELLRPVGVAFGVAVHLLEQIGKALGVKD